MTRRLITIALAALALMACAPSQSPAALAMPHGAAPVVAAEDSGITY